MPNLTIKAGTNGQNYHVTPNLLNPDAIVLKSTDGAVTIHMPRALWPFLQDDDMIMLFLSTVRVGMAEPEAQPLIEAIPLVGFSGKDN